MSMDWLSILLMPLISRPFTTSSKTVSKSKQHAKAIAMTFFSNCRGNWWAKLPIEPSLHHSCNKIRRARVPWTSPLQHGSSDVRRLHLANIRPDQPASQCLWQRTDAPQRCHSAEPTAEPVAPRHLGAGPTRVVHLGDELQLLQPNLCRLVRYSWTRCSRVHCRPRRDSCDCL